MAVQQIYSAKNEVAKYVLKIMPSSYWTVSGMLDVVMTVKYENFFSRKCLASTVQKDYGWQFFKLHITLHYTLHVSESRTLI
jgi:hypothetical protein